jgi:quercetin dioxygenase-like cupin family protein
MTMSDHVPTVTAIYEAFGRGDVAAILEHLDDDIHWEPGARDTGLAHLRERRGRAEVAEFFTDLAATLELTHFEPLAICAAGDYVTVPVRHAGSIVGGGPVPLLTEAHVWRFGPHGKVVEFQHLFDYAVHELAAGARARGRVGRTLRVLEDDIRVEVAGEQLEVFELEGPRDSGPPPHAHPWDELYVGIAGEIEVEVGAVRSRVRAGDVLHVPGGALHCYRIVSERARVRVVTSGHRASGFFVDMDAHVPAGAPTAESLPAVVAVARRNGLVSPVFA